MGIEVEEYFSVLCYYKILKSAIEKNSVMKADDTSMRLSLLQLVEELIIKKKLTSREALENILALFLILADKIEDQEFLFSIFLLVKTMVIVGLQEISETLYLANRNRTSKDRQ